MKTRFSIFDPIGKDLFLNFPQIDLLLHFEHDPVSPVITHVNGKKGLVQSVYTPEIELSQSAISFYQLGKLDVLVKLNEHVYGLCSNRNNFRARLL